MYKPPNADFTFEKPINFENCDTKIVLGDFNSHNTTWGYLENDQNGENVETWAENEGLSLIHDPKLPPSFNSGRWRKGYNPDLIFISDKINTQAVKNVCDPIPNTQHRALMVSVTEVVRSQTVPFQRRFNFRKAKWEKFRDTLDKEVWNLDPNPKNYEAFVEKVKKTSRLCIPRGCRERYVCGMTEETSKIKKEYEKSFTTDPFSEETIMK